MKTIAIIIARGGSKGIPNKNIYDFYGKPLISWTIKACLNGGVDSVWVSSDSDEILNIAKENGARLIKRPVEFATDKSSSESAWIHAINYISQSFSINPEWVIAPQVSSPLTEPKDIISALDKINNSDFDSFFSACRVEDLLIWEEDSYNNLNSINYNWRDRKRRQDIKHQFIENGAFYAFKPEILIQSNNRFGNKIGVIEMESWKLFELDEHEDIEICKHLMQKILIKETKSNQNEFRFRQ
jgi:CMP-N,N'-diacetyllegionaminic acid synthase